MLNQTESSWKEQMLVKLGAFMTSWLVYVFVGQVTSWAAPVAMLISALLLGEVYDRRYANEGLWAATAGNRRDKLIVVVSIAILGTIWGLVYMLDFLPALWEMVVLLVTLLTVIRVSFALISAGMRDRLVSSFYRRRN